MMINFIFSLLPKYSILNFYLIDSFRNDDDFLAALLVMGVVFFILAIIIGIALVLIFFATLLVLIGVGLISASVLVGLQQKSLSKGFKTLFLSSSILGTTIISVIFFWFLNRIEDWWSNDVSIFAGIAVGFLSGWILGIIIFTAAKKMVLFLKNKYDQKFNRKINETTNDLVDFKMKNNSIFIVIILLISFFSCQKKEKTKAEFSQYQEEKDYSSREDLKLNDAVLDEDAITKIEMSRYGGRPGINVTLTITADSVRYYYKQNSTDVNISKNKINTYTDWDKIIHSFLLQDFAKLKSGKSRQPADGVDVKFTVVTKSKTYNVVNFESDPSHHKINEFVNLLNEYEKKMIVQGK